MDLEADLSHYLKQAGIEPAASKLYIELIKTGHSSALQLAKNTGVSRTQVYRYLEALQAVGLVSAESLSYGTLFRAQPLENIEALIADREAQTKELRLHLGTMTEVLQQIAGAHGPKATVQHYYGIAGLKQANWNLTKAEKAYYVFEVAHLNTHLDAAFARRHRERIMEKRLATHDLTNATSVTAAEIEPFDPNRTFLRHIDPQVLTINFEVYLYNNVVTLLDYTPANQMAIEIHHPALHDMMQQLFNAMWNLGSPLTID